MATPSGLAKQAVAGSAFAAALTVSGVWVPSVIVAQMHLDDFRMMRMFLTASGASIILLNYISSRKLPPRGASPIAGCGGTYAGNVIGGLMQGLGMTLAGACASTVVVQAGAGISPGLYTLAGTALGGFLFVPVSAWIQARNTAAATEKRTKDDGDKKKKKEEKKMLTIYEHLGISRATCVLVFEAVLVGVTAALTYHAASAATKKSTTNTKSASSLADAAFIDPVIGGLLVATAQAVALLTRGTPLGMSNLFEEIGNILWAGVDSVTGADKDKSKKKRNMTVNGLAFAGGAALTTSVLVHKVLPALTNGPALEALLESGGQGLTPARAVLGGVMIGLGSRISGGCTSGHGISGMSLLSTSSIVTTACIFLGGLGFGLVI